MFLFGNINKGLMEYKNTPGSLLVDVRETDEFASGKTNTYTVSVFLIGQFGKNYAVSLWLFRSSCDKICYVSFEKGYTWRIL